jgi:hypothetical protein
MTHLRAVVVAMLLASSMAFAASDADRRFIREGMSEGEVLLKIGKPDTESVDSGGGAQVVVKRWIYMPSPGDPQTMTTITFRGGKVTDVSRQIAR